MVKFNISSIILTIWHHSMMLSLAWLSRNSILSLTTWLFATSLIHNVGYCQLSLCLIALEVDLSHTMEGNHFLLSLCCVASISYQSMLHTMPPAFVTMTPRTVHQGRLGHHDTKDSPPRETRLPWPHRQFTKGELVTMTPRTVHQGRLGHHDTKDSPPREAWSPWQQGQSTKGGLVTMTIPGELRRKHCHNIKDSPLREAWSPWQQGQSTKGALVTMTPRTVQGQSTKGALVTMTIPGELRRKHCHNIKDSPTHIQCQLVAAFFRMQNMWMAVHEIILPLSLSHSTILTNTMYHLQLWPHYVDSVLWFSVFLW